MEPRGGSCVPRAEGAPDGAKKGVQLSITMGLRRFGVALACVLAACGTEAPLDIGSDLSPIDVESFEVELPADVFISQYHNFAGYVPPREVGYGIIATDYDGELDVRSIARFVTPPSTIMYARGGATYTDSTPTYPGARVVIVSDTARSGSEDVVLNVYRSAEAWDPLTVSWTMRVDSVGERSPWSQPGGTLGELVAQIVYNPQVEDSVVVDVDSATIAMWTDTTDNSRGLIFVAESAGARIRIREMRLQLDVRPGMHPDTTIQVVTPVFRASFMINVDQPQPNAFQVGGVPAWRTYIELAERLDTLTVCGGSPEQCHRLADLRINYASLVLTPTSSRTGMAPEDTVQVQARSVSITDLIPLERSPLRERLTPGHMPTIPAAPGLFKTGGGGGRVEIPMTTYISELTRSDGESADDQYIALLAVPEGGLFGHAAFHAEGEFAPRLRLIVSSTKERDAP